MTQDILDQNIVALLGIDSLEPDAQAQFIEDIGSNIMEAAVTQLVLTLSEEQTEQLEDFMDKDPTPMRLLKHLTTHYSAFEKILEAEIVAFKEEVIAVMPPVREVEAEIEAAG